ncbi:hypothetical protein JR316_0008413 [Psilocybe cubensis]|uniref:Uncharacterized protein n=2 Tax=Psilocybe cubensis TaxID=181762 RepID=A0A8H8CJA0_PSICU|nr:hypothetical protein JR316_0008413 [Psilocybe cubensis]KAH9479818.1 hypothetical protein JR316_0008413 [Psilocybe cubensis]
MSNPTSFRTSSGNNILMESNGYTCKLFYVDRHWSKPLLTGHHSIQSGSPMIHICRFKVPYGYSLNNDFQIEVARSAHVNVAGSEPRRPVNVVLRYDGEVVSLFEGVLLYDEAEYHIIKSPRDDQMNISRAAGHNPLGGSIEFQIFDIRRGTYQHAAGFIIEYEYETNHPVSSSLFGMGTCIGTYAHQPPLVTQLEDTSMTELDEVEAEYRNFEP